MKRTNNHVVNDGPIREATIILQLTLLHVNQTYDVHGIILSVSLNSMLKHSSIIEVLNKDQVHKMMFISKLNIDSLFGHVEICAITQIQMLICMMIIKCM